MIHNLQVSANVALYKTMPFDTEKDLMAIAMLNSNPLVLVGRKDAARQDAAGAGRPG